MIDKIIMLSYTHIELSIKHATETFISKNCGETLSHEIYRMTNIISQEDKDGIMKRFKNNMKLLPYKALVA